MTFWISSKCRRHYTKVSSVAMVCVALLGICIYVRRSTEWLLRKRIAGSFATTRSSSLLSFENQQSYSHTTKVILLWHKRNKNDKFVDPIECGECVFTTDRSSINDTDTAAVLFRAEKIVPELMPPAESRRKDQLYIWTTGEAAPALLRLRNKDLVWETEYNFNMTMSYRRDSTLYHPYGTAGEAYDMIKERGYHNNPNLLLFEKTNLAAAVVSNCKSTPGAEARLDLLHNLESSGLKVDLFGKCFNRETVPKGDNANFDNVLRKYKFYLAFENSYHCRDYITEKFYRNALNLGVVPVVWGTAKEDYKAVAPAGSFIHVEDFLTTDDLTSYLNYLDRNDTAYLEYFSWYSEMGRISGLYGRDYNYCILCQILHGRDVEKNFAKTDDASIPTKVGKFFFTNTTQRTIASLRSWFLHNSNDCLRTPIHFPSNKIKIQ